MSTKKYNTTEIKSLVACDSLLWPFYYKQMTVLQCKFDLPTDDTSECSSDFQFLWGLHSEGDLLW